MSQIDDQYQAALKAAQDRTTAFDDQAAASAQPKAPVQQGPQDDGASAFLSAAAADGGQSAAPSGGWLSDMASTASQSMQQANNRFSGTVARTMGALGNLSGNFPEYQAGLNAAGNQWDAAADLAAKRGAQSGSNLGPVSRFVADVGGNMVSAPGAAGGLLMGPMGKVLPGLAPAANEALWSAIQKLGPMAAPVARAFLSNAAFMGTYGAMTREMPGADQQTLVNLATGMLMHAGGEALGHGVQAAADAGINRGVPKESVRASLDSLHGQRGTGMQGTYQPFSDAVSSVMKSVGIEPTMGTNQGFAMTGHAADGFHPMGLAKDVGGRAWDEPTVTRIQALAREQGLRVRWEDAGTQNEHLHFEPARQTADNPLGAWRTDPKGRDYVEFSKSPQQVSQFTSATTATNAMDDLVNRQKARAGLVPLHPELDPSSVQEFAARDAQILQLKDSGNLDDAVAAGHLQAQRNADAQQAGQQLEAAKAKQKLQEQMDARGQQAGGQAAPGAAANRPGAAPGAVGNADVGGVTQGTVTQPLNTDIAANAPPVMPAPPAPPMPRTSAEPRAPLASELALPTEVKPGELAATRSDGTQVPVAFSSPVDQALYALHNHADLPDQTAVGLLSHLQQQFPGESSAQIMQHAAEVATEVRNRANLMPVDPASGRVKTTLKINDKLNFGKIREPEAAPEAPPEPAKPEYAKLVGKLDGTDTGGRLRALMAHGLTDEQIHAAHQGVLPHELISEYRNHTKREAAAVSMAGFREGLADREAKQTETEQLVAKQEAAAQKELDAWKAKAAAAEKAGGKLTVADEAKYESAAEHYKELAQRAREEGRAMHMSGEEPQAPAAEPAGPSPFELAQQRAEAVKAASHARTVGESLGVPGDHAAAASYLEMADADPEATAARVAKAMPKPAQVKAMAAAHAEALQRAGNLGQDVKSPEVQQQAAHAAIDIAQHMERPAAYGTPEYYEQQADPATAIVTVKGEQQPFRAFVDGEPLAIATSGEFIEGIYGKLKANAEARDAMAAERTAKEAELKRRDEKLATERQKQEIKDAQQRKDAAQVAFVIAHQAGAETLNGSSIEKWPSKYLLSRSNAQLEAELGKMSSADTNQAFEAAAREWMSARDDLKEAAHSDTWQRHYDEAHAMSEAELDDIPEWEHPQVTAAKELAASAKDSPQDLDNFIDAIEPRLQEHGQSLVMTDEQTQAAAAIKSLSERFALDVEAATGVKPPTDPDTFAVLLARHMGTSRSMAEMDPQALELLTQALRGYEAKAKDGTLTQEEHSGLVHAISSLLQDINIDFRTALSPVKGTYSPATGITVASTRANFFTLAHEMLHGLTLTNKEFAGFMKDVHEKIGAKDRAKLAASFGFNGNSEYVYDTSETAVRAFQSYMMDGDKLKADMPKVYSLVDKAWKAVPEAEQQALGMLKLAHDAAETADNWRANKRSKYSGYGFLDRLSNSEVEASKPDSRAGKLAYANERKEFNDLYMRDGTYWTGVKGMGMAELRDAVMEQQTVHELASGGEVAQEKTKRGLTPYALERTFKLMTAEPMADSLQHERNSNAWEQVKKIASPRAVLGHLYGGTARFMDAVGSVNGKSATVDENGLTRNPGLHVFKAAYDSMASGLAKSQFAHFMGPDGLMHSEALQAVLPSFKDNSKAAFKSWFGRLGKYEAIDPQVRAELNGMFKRDVDTRSRHSEADIQAADVSDNSKALYRQMAKIVDDKGSQHKMWETHQVLKDYKEYSDLAGKGYTPEQLLAGEAGKPIEGQAREELNAVVAHFHEGYFPQSRLGDYVVHVPVLGKAPLYSVGADSMHEAKELQAQLRERFKEQIASGEAKDVQINKKELPFAGAANLADKASFAQRFLHMLHETEGGEPPTSDELARVISAIEGKKGIQAILTERKNIPGAENNDPVRAVQNYVNIVDKHMLGTEFKQQVADVHSMMPEWGRLRSDLTPEEQKAWVKTQQATLERAYNNSIGKASDLDAVTEKAFDWGSQVLGKDLGHFRDAAAGLAGFTHRMMLGFANWKNVMLGTTHFLQAHLPELTKDAAGLSAQTGIKAPGFWGLRTVSDSVPDALRVMSGKDTTSDLAKAWQQAQAMGEIRLNQEGGYKATANSAFWSSVDRVGNMMSNSTDEFRQLLTFASNMRMLEHFGKTGDDAVQIAARQTARSLDMSAANRPTVPLMNGSWGNLFMQYKGYLYNLADKAQAAWNVNPVAGGLRALAGKGEFKGTTEIPNLDWKQGDDPAHMMTTVQMSTMRPLLMMLGMSGLVGGAAGVPGVGLALDMWDWATGDDIRLEMKNKLAEWGFKGLGDIADKGVVGALCGIPMNEAGALFFPDPQHGGLLHALMPASFSIMADLVNKTKEGALAESGTTPAWAFKSYQVLKAISPNSIKRWEETGETIYNQGNVYDKEGNLVTKMDTLDMARTALGGLRMMKDDDYRAYMLDKNVRDAFEQRTKATVKSIAEKMLGNGELSEADIQFFNSVPDAVKMVQRKAGEMQTPSEERMRESIMKTKNPEEALERWQVYQMVLGSEQE